jgi:CBS domain-containing membrane protein
VPGDSSFAPRLRVADLMTPQPVAITVDADIVTAHDLMAQWHIRHLPVIDAQGRVIGLVSHRDLAACSLFADRGLPGGLTRLEDVTVASVMSRPVATVAPDSDVGDAARVMLEHKYGCLPVVSDGQLVGILTEADFVRLLAPGN